MIKEHQKAWIHLRMLGSQDCVFLLLAGLIASFPGQEPSLAFHQVRTWQLVRWTRTWQLSRADTAEWAGKHRHLDVQLSHSSVEKCPHWRHLSRKFDHSLREIRHVLQWSERQLCERKPAHLRANRHQPRGNFRKILGLASPRPLGRFEQVFRNQLLVLQPANKPKKGDE